MAKKETYQEYLKHLILLIRAPISLLFISVWWLKQLENQNNRPTVSLILDCHHRILRNPQ